MDELLVVVVIASMALTPVAVDLALKVAGPELTALLEPCVDDGMGSGDPVMFDGDLDAFNPDQEACQVSFELQTALVRSFAHTLTPDKCPPRPTHVTLDYICLRVQRFLRANSH